MWIEKRGDKFLAVDRYKDYMTGKTVASCRASSKGAWTRQRDVDRAISKLASRIKSVWK